MILGPWTLVLLALAAAATLAVRHRLAAARAVSVGAGLVALVGALVHAVVRGAETTTSSPDGLRAGGLEVPLATTTGGWVDIVAVVVLLVTAAVQVFAVWYLADDDRYPVFAATVSLFSAAMLLVVHSADLLLTVVGWEVMGWCSYLLIGHWSRRESARRAALKAFLVTRVADIGFVLGVVGLAAGAQSTRLSAVVTHWTATGPDAPSAAARAGVLCLLVVGILGKSAQFPFQDWLPDAMEGPTPASALIHAATMVAAGTVVLAHLFPVLLVSEPARWFLGVVTAVTMVAAACLALGQTDLKRLLAWSTVSQVAVMLSGLAAAPDGPGAGLFHMWSHAVFKSLLFLGLGWLSVVAGGTTARLMRGSMQGLPLAWLVFLFGLFSLAGIPFVVGGLSKEHVVAEAYAGSVSPAGPGLLVLVALLATVVVTAAYATRAFLILTIVDGRHAGRSNARARAEATHAAPIPVWAQVVLGVLLALTVLGGLVLLTGAFDLRPAGALWVVVTFVLVLLGFVFALRAGGGDDSAVALIGEPRMTRWFDTGLGADTAYVALVARPVLASARLVAHLDREVIDAYVSGAAALTRVTGALGERAHRRERPAGGLWLVVAGLLALGTLSVLGVVAWS